MLKRLKQQGITILVSTPYMDEAALCDRVALIQDGSILSINTPEQIVHSFGFELVGVRAAQMLQLLNDLKAAGVVENVYPSGIYHHVNLKKGTSKELLNQ
jgi:ABC-type multidrug transport system ATPase subunit